jgi:hypothetical protein
MNTATNIEAKQDDILEVIYGIPGKDYLVVLAHGFNPDMKRCKVLIDAFANRGICLVRANFKANIMLRTALEIYDGTKCENDLQSKVQYNRMKKDVFSVCSEYILGELSEFISQYKIDKCMFVGLSAGAAVLMRNYIALDGLCKATWVCCAPSYIHGIYKDLGENFHLIWDKNDNTVKYLDHKTSIEWELADNLHSIHLLLTERQGHNIGVEATKYICDLLPK